MIAQVVPAMRIPNAGPFDYSVPEGFPALEPGSLALVRFRGKRTPALVFAIRETSDVAPARLLPIEAALCGGTAVVSAGTLELLPRLARHYGVPLPLLLLSLLPSVPARPQEIALPERDGESDSGNSVVIQIASVFDRAAVTDIVSPELRSGPLLVLSPTVNHSEWLRKALGEAYGPVAVYHGSLRPKDAFAAWTSLLTGQARALISTRGGVLAPLPEEGRTLIFSEEEPSFIQFDAEPRYDARFVTRARARAEGRRLVTLSEAPTLASYADAAERRMLEAHGSLELVRLDDERRGGFKGMFSDRAVEALQEALTNRRDAVVCVNRKGTALAVRCADCYKAVSCADCSLPMRSYGRSLRCPRCARETAVPSACPACGGSRLIGRGLTADSAVLKLRELFPGYDVAPLESETDLRATSPAVFVGTEAIVHSLRPALESRPIGAVLVPHAEQLLGLGDYSDSEEAYGLLRALQALASRQGARFVLQTYTADNPAIQALDWDSTAFYENCLKEREEFGYPPSWTYVRATAPRGLPPEDAEKTLKKALPEGSRVDFAGECVYICRFKPGDSPLPEGFARLGPEWSWRANPRYAEE